jgi:DNA-binding transcriptional regulator LsrR (DeoR family)
MPRGPATTISRAIRLLMAAPMRTPDLAERLGITRRGAEKVLASIRQDWEVKTEERPGVRVGGFPEKWHQVIRPKKVTKGT